MNVPVRYLPVALDLRGRRVLVVGGGVIGTQRVRDLAECGASVRVISPEVSDELGRLTDAGLVALELRRFEPGDCNGAWAVVAATDEPATNDLVFREAEELGILASVTDDPAHCNFIFASSLHRGPLTVSIFTHGAAPVLSRRVRRELETYLGPEYETMAGLLTDLRSRLRSIAGLTQPQRQQVLERVTYSEGLLLLREGQLQEACRVMRREALRELATLLEAPDFDSLDWPAPALTGG